MADETRDPYVLAPGRAPTPFTADEIRGGCPAGRTIRLRVDVVSDTPFHRVSRFVECDEAGATMERSRLSLDGSPLAEPEVDRVTWRDLQAHASFAADDTTIESERIETAIGELDCLRYTVRDGATEEVFWFAKDMPGMPIQMRTTRLMEDARGTGWSVPQWVALAASALLLAACSDESGSPGAGTTPSRTPTSPLTR